MNKITRNLNELAGKPWLVTIGTIASIASFIWLFYDKIIAQGPGIASLVSFFLCFLFFIIVNAYSIQVRKENESLECLGHYIHEINHTYRDILAKLFAGDYPETDSIRLLGAEKIVLKQVCEIISTVFTGLTGGSSPPCIVTIKLLKKNEKGRVVAVTHVRSHSTSRDEEDPREYEVGNKENIAFDVALTPRPAGECAHFFSSDLTRLGDQYRNQRQSWRRHYKSAIVVPIRYLNREKLGKDSSPSDDIGFLSVDSQAKNRLNGNSHVELLSAFADQMYNFMSLMRGKYNVLVTAVKED